MEKLIELLNQCEKEKKSDNHWGLTYDNELIGLSNIREARLSVISKEYGFIKRLVENDKIRKDIYRPIPFKIKIEYEDGVRYIEKLEDRILMELSIQDNPIEFLVSILK